jgi:hypothetical protein
LNRYEEGRQYAKRRPMDLEPYYHRHVAAMTEEELHHKADIAAELAFRDKRIGELAELLIDGRGIMAEFWATGCKDDVQSWLERTGQALAKYRGSS